MAFLQRLLQFWRVKIPKFIYLFIFEKLFEIRVFLLKTLYFLLFSTFLDLGVRAPVFMCMCVYVFVCFYTPARYYVFWIKNLWYYCDKFRRYLQLINYFYKFYTLDQLTGFIYLIRYLFKRLYVHWPEYFFSTFY